MRLLLIEDEDHIFELIHDTLVERGSRVELVRAKSRDSAEGLIRSEDFDLILCDLKIPPDDDSIEANVEHGIYAFDLARSEVSGTPISFLTGFGTQEVMDERLGRAPVCDVFGNNQEFPISRWFGKTDFDPCIDLIQEFEAELQILNQIEVVGVEGISEHQKRVLRIFSRRKDGAVVKLGELGGGLSASVVLRADVYDKNEGSRASVVAKIADLQSIKDELDRYNKFVSPTLLVGEHAHFTDSVTAGASHLGGNFYIRAEGYDRTLFDSLETGEEEAMFVVSSLRALQAPWRRAGHPSQMSVADIRRRIITDEEIERFRPKLTFPWEDFESKTVQVREIIQHGDLHGSNVLISGEAKPLLIDYGDVGMAVASLDPIVLELSPLFHPRGLAIRGDWPNLETASKWDDLVGYLDGCPFQGFVRACRQWAFADSLGEQAVYANVYVHAIRQLRYDNADHSLAIAIASRAVDRALSS